MAEAPYIPWFTSDFLNGVADLEASEIGIYTIVLTLMGDQSGPIDDDPRWIARRCGSTTRRVNACLKKLEAGGKITRKNGVIGNRKMLELIRKRVKKSAQTSAAAQQRWENWRSEHKPQLPFSTDPVAPDQAKNSEKKSGKNAKISQEKNEKNTPVKIDDSQNSADQPMQTHLDSRSRANPEPYNTNQPTSITSSLSARGTDNPDQSGDWSIDNDRDLMSLLEKVSEVAGYVPRGARGYGEAIDFVKGWRNDGISFVDTVLPVISGIMAESDEPTNSLRRFDRSIRHRHAKLKAVQDLPEKAKPAPPPEPITSFDDEDERRASLREDLLTEFGPTGYSFYFHKRRFDIVDTPQGDALRTHARNGWAPPLDEIWHRVKPLVKAHGWSDIW
jgi:uncharacterized protein YdaU (DUF1376 family)